MHKHLMLLIAGVALFFANACSPAGDDGPAPPPDDCGAGAVTSVEGACSPVGVQGCVPEFLDSDGFCRPTIEKCSAGTIPKFDEGCVPVGIEGCAPEFLGADGVCRPTMSACAPGEMALPTVGCVAIDGPDGCGSAPWGNLTDDQNTVWVDANAAPGGDGSQAKPLASLAAALEKAPPNGRVALAAGDYDDPLVILKPLEVVGRCASMVRVHGVTPDTTPPSIAVVVGGGKTGERVLRNLTLEGDGVGLFTDTSARLDRVAIRGAKGYGIVALGPLELELTRTLVVDTRALNATHRGRGVVLQAGAQLVVNESVFSGNRDIGIYASDDGTRVVVERSLVEGTLSRDGTKLFGRGLEVNEGAAGVVMASAILGNRESAIYAGEPKTTLTVERSVLADTLPEEATNEFGHGLQLAKGASATVRGTAVVGNRAAGIVAAFAGTTLDVEGTLVAKTEPQATNGLAGQGLLLRSQAEATVRDSVFDGNRMEGIVLESRGVLALERSLVTRTAPVTVMGAAILGRGLVVYDSSRALVSDSAFLANSDIAVLSLGGYELDVSRTLIEDTRPNADGSYGMGMALAYTKVVGLRDAAILRSATAGILVTNKSLATVSRVLIDGVVTGKFHTYEGESLVVKATFDGVGDGLILFDAAATAEDVVVRNVARGGVVVDTGTGALARVRASGERYGLALQGASPIEWSRDDNVFVGGEEAVVSDRELPVPGTPAIPSQ